MQAIIEIQGQQFQVSEKDRITVQRFPGDAGKDIAIDRVLCLIDGEKIQLGKPVVEGASVQAKVRKHFRGDKIRVLRYKSKVNHHVVRGHRQDLTEIEILGISTK